MLATFALIGALFTAPLSEKVNFAHTLTAGKSLNYSFEFNGETPQGEMKVEALYTILVGDKATKGTNITFTPSSVKMNFSGQEMDQTAAIGESKYVLDEHGTPDTLTMDGMSAITTIPLLITYLPNKELEIGDTYPIDVKVGQVTFKGTGKYEGDETTEGKATSKLSVKATLGTGDGQDGSLDYTMFFDKESGTVTLLKGKASMESQEFTISLKK